MPTRLLDQNLLAMKHSIVLGELPQTFQDALAFTRELGMRYIWIDSLCIIQNSEEDWQRESAQMCQIYSNSFCNLAATSARDGSEGLFRRRDTRLLQSLPVRVGGMKHNVVDYDMWERQVEAAPLNRRAWVCQERILSPRSLHFSSTQVFWECNGSVACESFPLGLPSRIGRSSKRGINRIINRVLEVPPNLPETPNSPNDPQPIASAYEAWYYIVEVYSKAALTFETDKLVAIGGIAAILQPILHDSYLAGLWRRHLAGDLLWRCNYPYESKPKRYLAPSWSWASINDPIEHKFFFGTREEDTLIKIKSAEVELETANVFGQVKGGSICLEGKLFRMKHDFDGETDHYMIWADCLITSELVQMYILPDTRVRNSNGAEVSPRHDDWYCLPIIAGPRFSEIRDLSGLLLEASDNVGEFRRSGVFYWLRGKNLKAAQTGMQCFDARAEDSGLEYSDDGKGGYKYTITII
jgi:hypothetical protein